MPISRRSTTSLSVQEVPIHIFTTVFGTETLMGIMI